MLIICKLLKSSTRRKRYPRVWDPWCRCNLL